MAQTVRLTSLCGSSSEEEIESNYGDENSIKHITRSLKDLDALRMIVDTFLASNWKLQTIKIQFCINPLILKVYIFWSLIFFVLAMIFKEIG